MKQKILFISHCILNNATKLKYPNLEEQQSEHTAKKTFLKHILDNDIELIQLPCPEFLLYGSNRWGHAASQFNTPFFRKEAKHLLEPFVMQIEEYLSSPERFEILGIVGIDGSPSCGVHYTYDGDWGGELTTNLNLIESIHALKKTSEPGIFIDVFQNLLKARSFHIPFFSLETFSLPNATRSDKILS